MTPCLKSIRTRYCAVSLCVSSTTLFASHTQSFRDYNFNISTVIQNKQRVCSDPSAIQPTYLPGLQRPPTSSNTTQPCLPTSMYTSICTIPLTIHSKLKITRIHPRRHTQHPSQPFMHLHFEPFRGIERDVFAVDLNVVFPSLLVVGCWERIDAVGRCFVVELLLND